MTFAKSLLDCHRITPGFASGQRSDAPASRRMMLDASKRKFDVVLFVFHTLI